MGNNFKVRKEILLDEDLLIEIEKIAKEDFNAKQHRVSGKPEVTSTILYLLNLGIETLDRDKLKKNQRDKDNILSLLVDLKSTVSLLSKVSIWEKEDLLSLFNSYLEISKLVNRFVISSINSIVDLTDFESNRSINSDINPDKKISENIIMAAQNKQPEKVVKFKKYEDRDLLTDNQLSVAIGLSNSTISKIRRGKYNLDKLSKENKAKLKNYRILEDRKRWLYIRSTEKA